MFRRFIYFINDHFRNLKWKRYREKHGIPSKDEIRECLLMAEYNEGLELIAKLYAFGGFNLEEISDYLVNPQNYPTRFQLRNLKSSFTYRKMPRERIRQLLWKVWRIRRAQKAVERLR